MSRARLVLCLSAAAAAPLGAWACGLTADFSGLQGGYCANLSPHALLCDDFDEQPLGAPWTAVDQNTGPLTVDNAFSVSRPNSLLAHFSGGQSLDTVVRKTFPLPTPPSTVSFSFALRAEAVDSTGGPKDGGATALENSLVVAAIDFLDAKSNRYSVQFSLVEHGALSVAFEEESDAYSTRYPAVSLLLTDWIDVRVVVSRTGPTTAMARVWLGAAPELDTSLHMNVDATQLRVSLGSNFQTEPSSAWIVRYDNVTLDMGP